MYPTYRWADSYPHQATAMHYSPSDSPRAKEIPSHMMMDPSSLNSPYKPWLYGSNYWYTVPPECHGCCNHNYVGGPYSFRHPYHHYPPPPPPPCHTHGVYPPFPGTYPAYTLPPRHYSVEQPRYDYDKNTHTPHHCCGCNHWEDDKRLRIEREEPEVDKKTSDSLVPSHLKNYPYPIMWIPPGYMNTEPEAKEREKYSDDHVPLKPLEPSKQGGNGEAAQDKQAGDGYHLPFPIFWLPLKNNKVEKDTKENNLDQVTHNGSCFSGNDDKKKQPRKNEDDSCSEADSETINKHAVQKVIPVGTEQEKKSPKGIVTKEKRDSVEKTDNSADEKPSSKTSKLPPVCLRIDPLPRKKNGSRSPSPPVDERRSKESPTENTKSSQQQTQSSEGLKRSNEEQSKSNIKTIKVTDDVNKAQSQSLVDSCESVARIFEAKDCGEKGNKVEKKLSEHEAALIIQSAYRGFEVRISQPLMKLRQIAEVQKQVVELRNHIQDLESSSSTVYIDGKQKLIIGETIMSLLLKLDTIQGLHPIVRDIRKSVAKELVGLQEKLDSLTFVKPETSSMETTSGLKPDDVPILNPNPEDDAIQEKPDQVQTQSGSDVETVKFGTGVCEHHEVEATESQEDGDAGACVANLEPQVQLESQQITGELKNNQLQMLVDTEQPVNDAIQENSDRAQAEFGTNIETVDSDPVISENHKVGATESQNDGAQARDFNLKPHVELDSQQIAGELSNNQLQIQVETEQPVDDAIQEKSGQAQAQSESNVKTVESGMGTCELHEVEATESQDHGGVQTHDTNLDMKSQQSARELNNDQLQMSVETEQCVEMPPTALAAVPKDANVKEMAELVEVKAKDAADGLDKECEEPPKVDDTEVSMEDVGGSLPLLLTGSHDGDRNLIEENKRLKEAVEELMKAGNEQLGVITELTGRVNDLERKLSRKKKMKTRKCRSRGSVVQDEWRSCMV